MPTKKLERKLPKASEKFKDLFKKKREETKKKREEALKEFFKKKGDKSAPMPTPKRKDKFQRRYGEVPKTPRTKKKDGVISFKELERMQKSKPKVMEAKDGGKVSKFGMLSVKAGVDNNPNPTQADRIVGAKKKMNRGGAAGGPKKKRTLKDTVKKVIESFKNKPKVFGDIIKTGPKRVPRPKLPKPKKPGEITRVPRPKLPKPSDFNKPRTVTPAKRKRPKMMSTGGVAGRLAKRGYGKARS